MIRVRTEGRGPSPHVSQFQSHCQCSRQNRKLNLHKDSCTICKMYVCFFSVPIVEWMCKLLYARVCPRSLKWLQIIWAAKLSRVRQEGWRRRRGSDVHPSNGTNWNVSTGMWNLVMRNSQHEHVTCANLQGQQCVTGVLWVCSLLVFSPYRQASWHRGKAPHSRCCQKFPRHAPESKWE